MRWREHDRLHRLTALAAVGALGACGIVAARAMRHEQGPPFGTIDVLSLDGGGSAQAGGLRLDLTIGEPLAGIVLQNAVPAPLALHLGFWNVVDQAATTPVPGDTNGDGQVNVDDLINVILSWGLCPRPPATCPADVNRDGQVNVDDLIMVILNWG
jgi:hypothetical protein